MTYQTFFIKQVKDPHLRFNQVNDRLIVIEINQRPWDVLFHVLLLLQLEHMLIENKNDKRITLRADEGACAMFCNGFGQR